MNLLAVEAWFSTPVSFFWLVLLIFLLLLFPGKWLWNRYRKHNAFNSDIERILDHYFQTRRPGYAIMISGKWGIGKTYFIRRYLRRIQWNIFREFPVFVSLYGVENEAQIEQELVKKTLLSWRTIFSLLLLLIPLYFLKPLFPDLLGIVKRIGGENKIEFWGFVGPVLLVLVTYLYKIFKLNWLNLLLWKRPILFDDFERIKMNSSDMLAYLNRYVEHLHKHIVIICNEDELDKNDEKFRKVREKVIGRQLSFSQDSGTAMKNLLNTKQFPLLQGLLSEQFSWEWFQDVTTPKNENVNLRVWFFCCCEFESLFRGINRKLLHASQVWQNLIPQFFALKYSLQIHDFGNGRILDKKRARDFFVNYLLSRDETTNWFRTLFPNVEGIIIALPNSEWNAIIESCVSLDLQKIEESWQTLVVNKKNEKLWKRIYYYFEETDDEINQNWKELLENYRDRKINDPGQILNIFGSILSMISSRCCPRRNLTEKGALRFAKKYIRNMEFPEICKRDYSLIHVSNAYYSFPHHSSDSSVFKTFYRELDIELQNFQRTAIRELYQLFLKVLRSEKADVDKLWYDERMYLTDLFSGQSPKELLEVLRSLTPEKLRNGISKIDYYLKVNQQHYQTVTFWKDFINLTNTSLAQDEPHIDFSKQAMLRALCQRIENNIQNQ